MCGIFGCVGRIDEADAYACIHRIKHRGPDALAIKPLEGAVLAHARLAILDISDNANQPMSDQSGRYWIVYNGEVYNYLELRRELKQLGYHFNTTSDTEVVLYSYIEWGIDFQKKCNGMWGLAIWDDVKKELFLSRDRFGVKPLYYFEQDNQFYFASEMKAFFPIMKERKINYGIFEKKDYFAYEVTPNCCIKEIKKIQSGHYGYLKNGHLDLYRWWNTIDQCMDVPKSYDEQVEVLRELFLDACKIRIRSDVPIGTALSGGVDSSTVIGAMNYISKTGAENTIHDWQHVFVASLPGTSIDETKYAQMAANYVGLDIQKVIVHANISEEQLLQYVYMCEDPYIACPIAFIQTYQNISEHGIKATIDGHGADELFGGYEFDLAYAVLDDRNNKKRTQAIWETYNNISEPEYQMSYEEFECSVENISKLKTSIGDVGVNKLDAFNRNLYKQAHMRVLPTLLRCYDRYSMSNGVEIRMPFLDYRIVCFAFSIPWDSKIKDRYTKKIVRDMAAPFMDYNILYRRIKMGFNSPMTEWLQGDMKEFILDTIHSQDFYECELINPLDVSITVHEFYKRERKIYTDGEKVWAALAPFFWKKAMQL